MEIIVFIIVENMKSESIFTNPIMLLGNKWEQRALNLD